MKHNILHFLAACLLTLLSVTTKAQEIIQVSDIVLSYEKTPELSLNLVNFYITTLQADLYLPDNISLAEVKLKYAINDHQCAFEKQKDGAYRILVSSQNLRQLCYEDIICRLETSSEDVRGGEAHLKNIIAIDTDGVRHKPSDITFNIKEEFPEGSEAVLPLSTNRLMRQLSGDSMESQENTIIEKVAFVTNSSFRGGTKIALGIYATFDESNNQVTLYTKADEFHAPYVFNWSTGDIYWNGSNTSSGLFSNLSALTSIENIEALNTKYMKEMYYMFFGCSSLTDIDIRHFNIQNVASFYSIFDGCDNLKRIYLCPQVPTIDWTALNEDVIAICPEESYDAYVNDSFWSQHHIVKLEPSSGEWTLGDVNNDGDIDVLDLYHYTNGVLKKNDADLYLLPADLMSTGSLNIFGHSKLASKIGEEEPKTPDSYNEGSYLTMKYEMGEEKTGKIIFGLSCPEGVTRVVNIQADITFCDGFRKELGDVAFYPLDRNHNCRQIQRTDGSYRLIATSKNNLTFEGDSILHMPFYIADGFEGNTLSVSWDNVLFVLDDGQRLYVKPGMQEITLERKQEDYYGSVATDGETVQYLYNIEAKGFIVGANDWQTRASIEKDKAYAFKVKANGDGTYTLNDYVQTQAAWKAMFAVDGSGIWVDNLGGDNVNGWVVTPVAGEKNVYEITNPAAASGKLGARVDFTDTRLYINNEDGYGYRWTFIAEEDLNDFLALREEEIKREKQETLDRKNHEVLSAWKRMIDGTNIYGKTGYDAYVAQYEDYMQRLDNGTLDVSVVNPENPTEWHASTAYDFLLTPWTIGGKACSAFSEALYVNTWSTEGANDGTGFEVPFMEYWTNDYLSLAENTIATTVTGLEPWDVYEVNVWARVRIMDNQVGYPHGITMNVGDGDSVDLCAGSQNAGQFYLQEFTAEGQVDGNGNLNITMNILGDNNVSWLSFKNVKYEFARKGEPVLMGDADGDGVVTMADAKLVVRYCQGEYVSLKQRTADMNGDGKVTMADANAIVNMVLDK